MFKRFRDLFKQDDQDFIEPTQEEPETEIDSRPQEAMQPGERYVPEPGRQAEEIGFQPPAGADPASTAEEAEAYLGRLQAKVNNLASEFANGRINRAQFQELFNHYQRERTAIETWLAVSPESDDWQKAKTEGRSMVIRRQHKSRVVGYAIYRNDSGIPIATIGTFDLDTSLVVPMLSSYRAATKEIFGAGIQSSQIENGSWLCFVPGALTTLLAIFSSEPARQQLMTIEEIHRVFESANRPVLTRDVIDPNALFLPHQSYNLHRH